MERQPKLPHNHSALLRFRSDAVAKSTHIPFKKVQVIKTVEPHTNVATDALNYSLKVSGRATTDRSIISAYSGAISDRYVAPEDFIEKLAVKVRRIDYNSSPDKDLWKDPEIPIISTIPMHALAEELGYEWPDKIDFSPIPQMNLVGEAIGEVDAYASWYIPNPTHPVSRLSVTGKIVIAECHTFNQSFDKLLNERDKDAANEIADHFRSSIHDSIAHLLPFGVRQPDMHYMGMAKMLPIHEEARKRFILWASENHSVYSLGRYATWRPKLLLDDIPDDVFKIVRIVAGDQLGLYKHRLGS